MPQARTAHGSRSRWRLLVAVAVILAMLGGFAFWYLNGETDKTAGAYRDIGANVSAKDDAPNDIHAVIDAKSKPPFTEGVEVLGSVVNVTPEGPRPKPITLRFKLNQKVTDASEIIFATSESGQAGTWQLVPAAGVSPDGQYAYITTTHLSWWTPLKRDIGRVVDAIKNELKNSFDALTGDVTAEADKPKCQDESKIRSKGYSISSAGDSLYWCLGMENDKPTLKITNKRRYPLLVGHPNLKPSYQAKELE